MALAEDDIAELAAQGRCIGPALQSAWNNYGRERRMIIFCQCGDDGPAGAHASGRREQVSQVLRRGQIGLGGGQCCVACVQTLVSWAGVP